MLTVALLSPVQSLAASMSWQWTVTIIGDNYYKADGTASSTNRYTRNQYLDNSKDNEIGYKFAWNASAGGSNYKGGWQLCMTVNGEIVERTSAYIYKKNMSTAVGSWTAPGSSHTGTSSHPFIVYLSDYPAMTPNAPTENDVLGLLKVKLDCETYPAGDHDHVYDIEKGTFTIGAVSGGGTQDYICTVTVKGASYIDKLNETFSAFNHTWANDVTEKSITLQYDRTTAKWKLQNHHDNPVIFVVKCEGVTPPTPSGDPTDEDLEKALAGKIKVACNRVTAHSQTYGLLNGSYERGTRDDDKYTITVKAKEYVAAFNQTYPNHPLLGPESQQITLVYDNGEWKCNVDVAVTFTVHCEEPAPVVPDGPSDDDINVLLKVSLQCTAKSAHQKEYSRLLAESYEIGNVQSDGSNGFICQVSIYADDYVAAYSTETGVAHTLADQSPKTVMLRYDKEQRGWNVDSNSVVVFKMKCSEEPVGPSDPTPTPAPAGNVPKTGDSSQLGLWFALMMVSGTAVLLLAQKRRRKNAK